MKPGQTKVMIPQTHKIITEITIGYLTMPFPVTGGFTRRDLAKFSRVLIFAIFAVFPAIRKNKFPQIKIIAHIFPAKINSRVNIL